VRTRASVKKSANVRIRQRIRRELRIDDPQNRFFGIGKSCLPFEESKHISIAIMAVVRWCRRPPEKRT